MYAELSPVTDFREGNKLIITILLYFTNTLIACCRQYENGECTRGGFCNFMHLKHPSREFRRELMVAQRLSMKMKRDERHKPSRGRDRSNSPSNRSRDRGYDR
jgi:splicing factor U2AF subunit